MLCSYVFEGTAQTMLPERVEDKTNTPAHEAYVKHTRLFRMNRHKKNTAFRIRPPTSSHILGQCTFEQNTMSELRLHERRSQLSSCLHNGRASPSGTQLVSLPRPLPQVKVGGLRNQTRNEMAPGDVETSKVHVVRFGKLVHWFPERCRSESDSITVLSGMMEMV